MKRRSGILVFVMIALFATSVLFVPGNYSNASSDSHSGNKPVFVWLFGYTGDNFTPQIQLGITPSQVVSVAQSISSVVGASNLRLIAVVGEEPRMTIHSDYISTIQNYVSQLKGSASVLYGRLDLLQFNANSNQSLLSQVSLYESLGLNGVWFDHGPNLWQSMGPTKFNAMLESIVKAYPNLNIIMNQAVNKGGWITPAKGTTWGAHTFISPSVTSGGCCQVNLPWISQLNAIYPGQVLLHFDAFASVVSEPMGIFALKSWGFQESAVKSLVSQGIHPKSSKYAFDFQFPVLGAWTYIGGKYHGNLYNSLTFGNFHQGTESSFVSVMKTV